MLWIHSDHLHSATILTDAAGAELRRLAYRAFGEDAENVGSGNEPKYSYTGKERDATGLMYYGARYYDPALSRFITPDTMYDRGPQGLNHYSYALNNPIRYNDPSGHQAINSHWFKQRLVKQFRSDLQSAKKAAPEAAAIAGTALGVVLSASPDDFMVEAVQYAADNSGNKTLSKAVMIGGIFFSLDDVLSPRAWKKAKNAIKEIFGNSGDEVVEKLGEALAERALKEGDELAEGASKNVDDLVRVFHGSADDTTTIMNKGLDPKRRPTWVSTDEDAAVNAITKRYDTPKDPGIIESRIPKEQFEQVLKPSERSYSGFGGEQLNSTEIVLRDQNQVNLFNQNIVK